MKRFIVAPKRDAEIKLTHEWVEKIAHISGIEIIGEGPVRMQIGATPSGLKELERVLGNTFYIEELTLHRH